MLWPSPSMREMAAKSHRFPGRGRKEWGAPPMATRPESLQGSVPPDRPGQFTEASVRASIAGAGVERVISIRRGFNASGVSR